MSKITATKIGNAKVISNDLLPKGASIPGRLLASVSYITIHNTGLVDVKANNFHRSLKRENALPNGRQASWTFSVDDTEIYQEVPMNWETWHAGNSTGNKNSISIELCMWSNKEKQRLTYENGARLVAEIMKIYKIPVEKVVQHNHWSGKDCPQYLRSGKHGYNWTYFINLVKQYYNEITNVSSNTTTTTFKVGTYQKDVKVTSDVLNVREQRGTKDKKGNSIKILGTLKKGKVVNVWYIGKATDGSLWGSIGYNNKTGFIHLGYVKPL